MRGTGVDDISHHDRPLLDPKLCVHRQASGQVDDVGAFDSANGLGRIEQVSPMKMIGVVHLAGGAADEANVVGEIALERAGQFLPDLSGSAENCLHLHCSSGSEPRPGAIDRTISNL